MQLKFPSLLVLGAALTAPLTTAQDSDAPVCQISQLSLIASNPNVQVCQNDVGFAAADLEGVPTDAQLAKVCASETCVELFSELLALNITDCHIPTGGGILFISEFVNPVVEYCASEGIIITASGVSSGTGSGSTATAGTVDAGDDEKASASASGSAGDTPAPTGAASHAAFASGSAMLVALIASLL